MAVANKREAAASSSSNLATTNRSKTDPMGFKAKATNLPNGVVLNGSGGGLPPKYEPGKGSPDKVFVK